MLETRSTVAEMNTFVIPITGQDMAEERISELQDMTIRTHMRIFQN